jgi:hypothetical protein
LKCFIVSIHASYAVGGILAVAAERYACSAVCVVIVESCVTLIATVYTVALLAVG